MNGKNHDRGIIIGTAVITAATLPLLNPTITMSLAIGNTFGGLWLSPDLDLAHSRPSKRWGLLAWYWDVYRAVCDPLIAAKACPIVIEYYRSIGTDVT